MSPTVIKVPVADGKYEVQIHSDGKLSASRYGEHWRDLSGDNLIYGLASELREAREALARLRALGVVYVRPDDWRSAKMGGPPTLEDCDQIDLSNY